MHLRTDLNPKPHALCGLGQVTCPLRTSHSTGAQWVPESPSHGVARSRGCAVKTLRPGSWRALPAPHSAAAPCPPRPGGAPSPRTAGRAAALGAAPRRQWATLGWAIPFTERLGRKPRASLGCPLGKPSFRGPEPPECRGRWPSRGAQRSLPEQPRRQRQASLALLVRDRGVGVRLGPGGRGLRAPALGSTQEGLCS